MYQFDHVLMEKITVALDWTVNTNHIGLIYGLEKYLFHRYGIELVLLNPADDHYQLTPAKKVETGIADFAFCPMESVLSYRTKDNPFAAKAVAAIFKEDISAIVTLKRNDIQSPAHLDGKIYASYKARYEDQIVRQMIVNAGGKGDLQIIYPEKLGIWNVLLKGDADATWIFDNWEGVAADCQGVSLQRYFLRDYGIPYSYSPVLMTGEANIQERKQTYKIFLKLLKEAYLESAVHIHESADMLSKHVPESDRNEEFLIKSIRYSAQYFGAEHHWGQIDISNIATYLQWIYQQNLESTILQPEELFSNELLED